MLFTYLDFYSYSKNGRKLFCQLCFNVQLIHQNLFHPNLLHSRFLLVQDFLIKLGIKPLMHLFEISTFSLNNVIVRLTKIMNRADKNWAHF